MHAFHFQTDESKDMSRNWTQQDKNESHVKRKVKVVCEERERDLFFGFFTTLNLSFFWQINNKNTFTNMRKRQMEKLVFAISNILEKI